MVLVPFMAEHLGFALLHPARVVDPRLLGGRGGGCLRGFFGRGVWDVGRWALSSFFDGSDGKGWLWAARGGSRGGALDCMGG